MSVENNPISRELVGALSILTIPKQLIDLAINSLTGNENVEVSHVNEPTPEPNRNASTKLADELAHKRNELRSEAEASTAASKSSEDKSFAEKAGTIIVNNVKTSALTAAKLTTRGAGALLPDEEKTPSAEKPVIAAHTEPTPPAEKPSYQAAENLEESFRKLNENMANFEHMLEQAHQPNIPHKPNGGKHKHR